MEMVWKREQRESKGKKKSEFGKIVSDWFDETQRKCEQEHYEAFRIETMWEILIICWDSTRKLSARSSLRHRRFEPNSPYKQQSWGRDTCAAARQQTWLCWALSCGSLWVSSKERKDDEKRRETKSRLLTEREKTSSGSRMGMSRNALCLAWVAAWSACPTSSRSSSDIAECLFAQGLNIIEYCRYCCPPPPYPHHQQQQRQTKKGDVCCCENERVEYYQWKITSVSSSMLFCSCPSSPMRQQTNTQQQTEEGDVWSCENRVESNAISKELLHGRDWGRMNIITFSVCLKTQRQTTQTNTSLPFHQSTSNSTC